MEEAVLEIKDQSKANVLIWFNYVKAFLASYSIESCHSVKRYATTDGRVHHKRVIVICLE